MIPHSWFGNLSTWALIALAWAGCSIIVGLMVGIMARGGKGKDGGR